MAKYLFEKEYEFRSSPKILYPYISTIQGLESWFAEKAIYLKDSNLYNFVWDETDHFAKLILQKPNKLVKFEFEGVQTNGDPKNYIEFKIEANDLTNSAFLKVSDYSSVDDKEELQALWDDLVSSLKVQLGA